MKIGLIYDGTKKEAEKYVFEVKTYLNKKNIETLTRKGRASLSIKDEMKTLNFFLVFGGDGLLLRAANQAAPYGIPLVGVNFGRKGYLCGIEPKELKDKLEKILKKKYSIEERTRISAKIFSKSKGESVRELDALNEIVVGGINKTVWLKVNSEFFEAETRGDGILVATRTGSTAYNVRAGGSILFTEEIFSLVVICGSFDSHYLLPETKSIIIPSNCSFKIENLCKTKANLPWVTADSQRQHRLKKEESVLIKKSEYKTLLIKI